MEKEKLRKELQDKDEFHYMKMTTKILKGRREEVSPEECSSSWKKINSCPELSQQQETKQI